MVTYTDVQMLEYYRDWLQSIPFTVPKGWMEIDISQIQDSDRGRFAEGNALRLVSKAKLFGPTGRSYIGGTVEQRWQNNFLFVAWRDVGSDDLRAMNTEFFNQMVIWIDEQNLNRNNLSLTPLLPRFSHTTIEYISGVGGGEVALVERERGIEGLEYTIALQHVYETVHNPHY